jgi:hypothetical protein
VKLSQKIKRFFKKALLLLVNPRFLLCFGLAWIITNGWSYILLAIGSLAKINWMVTVSAAYMTFLWFPFTPEKIVTVALAILLLRLLFPRDEHTLGLLRGMYQNAKRKLCQRKKKQRDRSPLPLSDNDPSA